jgi:radical SAM superfamily enzyme YgiQ (UPF0313 family)
MRGPGDILLVSVYELGHPPHGVALPAAHLERGGFRPAAIDLAVERLDPERVRRARLVAVSVPMHTALRLGLAAAERVRAVRPDAVIAFHGLYAPPHAALLREAGAAAVLGADAGEALVALASAVERGEDLRPFQLDRHPPPPRPPLDEPVPSRGALPPLDRYARLAADDGEERLAGYAEATRGCKHRCRHCPLPPAYLGRFVAVPVDAVLADVAQQVEAGARHITFGDPDFLNGPTHARRVAQALHDRFPALSFDFTAKVEHLVAQAALLPELRACGAVLVTSAVESFSDAVLARLDKGHDRAGALRAFELCAAAGLALRPTFMPFTPWETLDGVLELFEVLEAHGLVPLVDPVQLSIRLLVPPGSLLEDAEDVPYEGFDPAALSRRWRHADPRMDALQVRLAAVAEDAAGRNAPVEETFARMRALALAAAGRPHAHVAAPRVDPRRVPRLTESWFC